MERLEALGQSLSPLSCAADRDWLGERVGAVRGGHTELRDWCERRAAMLEQALANAQLFGEEEVEVLNWLAEVAQRLAEVSVQSYQPDQLTQQHKHTLVRGRRRRSLERGVGGREKRGLGGCSKAEWRMTLKRGKFKAGYVPEGAVARSVQRGRGKG